MDNDSIIEPLSEFNEISINENLDMPAEVLDWGTSRIFDKKESKNSTKATWILKEKKKNIFNSKNNLNSKKNIKKSKFCIISSEKIKSNKIIKNKFSSKKKCINSLKVSPNLNKSRYKKSKINNTNSLFKNSKIYINRLNLKNKKKKLDIFKRVNNKKKIDLNKLDIYKSINILYKLKEEINLLILKNNNIDNIKIKKIKNIYEEIKTIWLKQN